MKGIGESVIIKSALQISGEHFMLDRAMKQYAGYHVTIRNYCYDLVNSDKIIGYKIDIDGGRFGWEDIWFE